MKKFWFVLVFAAAAVHFSAPNILADENVSSNLMKEISEKQDRILAELEAIKTELNIVKIRVSSS